MDSCTHKQARSNARSCLHARLSERALDWQNVKKGHTARAHHHRQWQRSSVVNKTITIDAISELPTTNRWPNTVHSAHAGSISLFLLDHVVVVILLVKDSERLKVLSQEHAENHAHGEPHSQIGTHTLKASACTLG